MKKELRTSLVVQWIGICLPMQGTWVPSLVQGDSTWHGAAEPMSHNYWACALERLSCNYRGQVLQLLKAVSLESVLCNKRSHCNQKRVGLLQLEKACTQQRRSRVAKNKEEKTGWGTEKNPDQKRINKKRNELSLFVRVHFWVLCSVHWYMFLCTYLWQYHTVLISVAIQWDLSLHKEWFLPLYHLLSG